MRTAAREAALNIIFSQQFNEDSGESFKKKIYNKFELEKEEDIAFANSLVLCVENNRTELIGQKRQNPSLRYLRRERPRLKMRL